MSGISLYTFSTPNGYKVSIFLEMLGLKYTTHSIDISKNTQKEPWFLELNPNGRIPTLVDHDTGITISETGAILQYLADTYDKDYKFSYPHGTKEYYTQSEILFFQMAGLGPMQGQAHHFKLYAKEKVPYGIERYTEETRRLYSVVVDYLNRNKESPFLVGKHITIADVAIYPWVIVGTNILDYKTEFPRLYQWVKDVTAVPGVKQGLTVPFFRPTLDDEFKI